MSTLNLQSATVMADGRVLSLSFQGALPANFSAADWQPGRSSNIYLSTNLAGISFEPMGAEVSDFDYTCNSNVGTTTGSLAAGTYYIAFTMADSGGVERIFGQVSYLTFTGTHGITIQGLPPLPTGYTFNIYISSANGAASTMALYATGVTGSVYNATSATWANASRFYTFSPNLYWTIYYLASAPIAYNSTVTITAPAGLWQDDYGNTTGAFSSFSVTNNSQVDSTGFCNPVYSLGTGGVTIYVSTTHGSDSNSYATAANNISAPVFSIGYAMSLLKNNSGNGKGCRIALLRGDTFYGGCQITISGQDATHPMLINDYWNVAYGTDPGTQPIVQAQIQNNGFTTALAGSTFPISYISICRITIQMINEDASSGGLGLNFSIAGSCFTISDCTIQGFAVAANFVGLISSNQIVQDRVSFIRCSFLDSFDVGSGRPNGINLSNCTNVLISQCLVDNSGRLSIDPNGGMFTAGNGITFNSTCNTPGTVVWGNLVRQSSQYGGYLLMGAVSAYNTFSENGTAAYLGTGGYLRKCVAEKSKDIYGLGSWSALANGGTATFTQGSATVTGVGTTFTTDVLVGQVIRPHSYTGVAVISSVTNGTNLVLNAPYAGTSVDNVPYKYAAWTSLPNGGTVTFTNGSTTVTGTGTNFSSDLSTSYFIQLSGSGVPYAIAAVVSSTQLTLATPYAGTTVSGATAQRATLPSTYTQPVAFTWNLASFTNGSTAVTGTNFGYNVGSFSTTVAAGGIIQPQIYQSSYLVASIQSDTQLTLTGVYKGVTQTTPVDVANLGKTNSGGGLMLNVNRNNTGSCATYQGTIENSIFATQNGTAPRSMEIATNLNSSAYKTQFISRNNFVDATSYGLGLEMGTIPSPTSSQLSVKVTHNVVDVSGSNYAIAYTPTTTPDFNWLHSDENAYYWTQANPVLSGATNQSLTTWKTNTGSESHSITTPTPTIVNGTADLGSYYASLGGTNSVSAYITYLRSRPKGTWSTNYDTSLIWKYYASQYKATNLPTPNTAGTYFGATAPTATTYAFSGPTTTTLGSTVTYGVNYPIFTTPLTVAPTITPASDVGGTFSPTTVTIPDQYSQPTFTFTPAVVGTNNLTTTNDSALTNPSGIALYVFYPTQATSYTLTGPSTSVVGFASAPFTVAIPNSTSLQTTTTITPDDGGAGGTFSPTTVTLYGNNASATFVYTAAAAGAITISTTDNQGLSDPAPLTITASLQTVAGVWANGTAVVYRVATFAVASAGVWANGTADYNDITTYITDTSGVWANGTADVLNTKAAFIASGGILINGTSDNNIIKNPFVSSGGIYINGTMQFLLTLNPILPAYGLWVNGTVEFIGNKYDVTPIPAGVYVSGFPKIISVNVGDPHAKDHCKKFYCTSLNQCLGSVKNYRNGSVPAITVCKLRNILPNPISQEE